MGRTRMPQDDVIKTIKDYYLFITGEECRVLDFPDDHFTPLRAKKYGNYNLEVGPEVQYMTSGQQHLLLLLIRICTARGGLLLLDEIELGLHEGYLERLSILINRNKKDLPQMLVSTHSPIFAGLNIENTHFIEKNGAGQ